MNILECSTRGGEVGRQFSAFIATMPCGRSIETIYQAAKRDSDGKLYLKGKGKPVFYMHINGENIPCVLHNETLRYDFYTMLWAIWFRYNPEKLEIARQYDGFTDRFDGKGGKVYRPGDSYITSGSTCQAASVAYLVATNGVLHLNEVLLEAFESYCKIYDRKIVVVLK
jgi:hypothetical protein